MVLDTAHQLISIARRAPNSELFYFSNGSSIVTGFVVANATVIMVTVTIFVTKTVVKLAGSNKHIGIKLLR